MSGRIDNIDLLVARYGAEALVVEVIEAERELRKAWKDRAKALKEKGS